MKKRVLVVMVDMARVLNLISEVNNSKMITSLLMRVV